MLHKKIPAFTLMEVTIAMLIAAIAIGVTFTAYRIVSGVYLDFTRKQNKVATFTTADQLLKQDFFKAKRIIKFNDGLTFEMKTGLINYSFKDDYILRDQFSLGIDTFKLKTSRLIFLFENEEAMNGHLVDQCSFETEVSAEPALLYYRKVYSAEDLFE